MADSSGFSQRYSKSCVLISDYPTLRFDTNHRYETVASKRLGRSDTYQEQYVFVYRWGDCMWLHALCFGRFVAGCDAGLLWSCAGLIQWPSLPSISTRTTDPGMLTLSPGSLSLSASEPQRQVSAILVNEKAQEHNTWLNLVPPTPISCEGFCPHTSTHDSNQHHEGARCTLRRSATRENNVEIWGED